MKSVTRDRHILHVLKGAKCNLSKAILKNCDDRFIQTLSEIVHNILIGNVDIDSTTMRKLKRYKSQLRELHQYIRKNKQVKNRRKKFINQTGGFLPLIIGV